MRPDLISTLKHFALRDVGLIRTAFLLHLRSFTSLPSEAQNNEEVACLALSLRLWSLGNLPQFRRNQRVVLTALQQDGFALAHASDELRNDREIVLAAVQQHGFALASASQELRNDREIVLAAVQQNSWTLRYASNALHIEIALKFFATRCMCTCLRRITARFFF